MKKNRTLEDQYMLGIISESEYNWEKYGNNPFELFLRGELDFFEMMTLYYHQNELYYLDPVNATQYACGWLFENMVEYDTGIYCFGGLTTDEYFEMVLDLFDYVSKNMRPYYEGRKEPDTTAPLNICHEYLVSCGIDYYDTQFGMFYYPEEMRPCVIIEE